MTIDPIITSVAKVTVFENNKIISTASGFFYENNSNLYFITNRHVVIDEEEKYFPDIISLRLHVDPNNLQNNADFEIELYDVNNKPNWKEHPIHKKKVDIVALPINKKDLENKYFIRSFSPAIHVPNDIIIPLAQDVIVMGFPKGFHDTVYNLPILRNATLASVYPVPFKNKPYVLIDSHLHGGTSGSPVITKPMNMVKTESGSMQIRTGNPQYLIGIHSASIDIEGTEDSDPLGLNCVWFASLIDDITK